MLLCSKFHYPPRHETHLEGKVLEDVSDTSRGFVTRASTNNDRDGSSRRTETILDAEDLDTSGLGDVGGSSVRPAEGRDGAGQTKKRHGKGRRVGEGERG